MRFASFVRIAPGTGHMEKTFRRIAELAEVPEDAGIAVKVEDRTIALFRLGDTVYAMDDACPHRGASLAEGICKNGKVFCNAHLFDFDLKTGHCEILPDFPVAIYEVRIEDGNILVLI